MRALKILLAVVAVLGCVSLAAAASPVPGSASVAPACTSRTVAVSLTAGGPADQRVSVELCAEGSPAGRTLQLLVPGFTYNREYWDPAYQPASYSYNRRATQAGYATLLFDRLGTGESSKPPALQTTVTSHAWVVHQLVGKLRAGEIGGTAFDRIVVVGHSMGAAIAQVEASTYGDVDGVVLSGWLHTPLWVGPPGLIITTVPAQLDPRFGDRPLLYVTSLPGARGPLFYRADAADAGMIAADEATKDTGTEGEVATVVPTILPGITRGIDVPVLLATGEHDALFCGLLTPCADAATVEARESLFFSPAACLTTYVQPGAGHSMNLHRNAGQWFDAATSWIDAVAGPSTGEPASGCAGLALSG